MILQDRHFKVSVIAHELGISAGTVSSYHPYSLDEVSSQWVQFSEKNLVMLRANPDNFFSRIISGDEIRVHHQHPESKQESTQWKHKESPTPKKFCVQQSAREIMATVFLGLRRFSAFGNHATQNNNYWRHLRMVSQWWLSTRISNRNTVESYQMVSCCFMTMHPHTSHAYRGLLQGNVAS